MASERSELGAAKALLVALPFALILAWTLPTHEPSRAELALALSRGAKHPISADDLRSIDCAQPGGTAYDCRWQQKVDNGWQSRRGRFSITAAGWMRI